MVTTTSFPCSNDVDDISGFFIRDLSQKLTDSYNVIVLAPHVKGEKTKEVVSEMLVYRFRYFWPAKWQKICGSPGVLSNLKRNKILLLSLPFLFISLFFKTIYLIKKERIDLIHAHCFFPAGLSSALASKICKKPLIVTGHGSDITVLTGRFWDKLRTMIAASSSSINVVTPNLAEELIKKKIVSPDKIFVASMGVETSLFSCQPKGEKKDDLLSNLSRPILLFIGRLIKIKGIDYLIRALPEITEKFPNVNLVIIGYGNEREKLESLARDLNINNVSFLGRIPNRELPYYYQQADIFVLPSFKEGSPVVLMEALSTGCPVVATKIAGIPYMIEDGENGLLINTGSVSEISRAVIRILTDNDLRENMIKKARKKAKEQYDWEVITNKFKQIYDKSIYG